MPFPIRCPLLVLAAAVGGAGCGLLWTHPEAAEAIGVVGAGVVAEVIDELPSPKRIDDVEAGKTSSNARDVLEVGPRTIDFGGVPATQVARREVTVANPQTFAVTIVRAHIVGPCFALEGPILPLTVGPGRTASMPVVLTASVGSACEATLILVIDSAGGRYARVRLRGQVRPPGVI